MNQASIFAMIRRLLAPGRGGSPVQWTRRFLVSGGASGLPTESQAPVTATVQAAQVEPSVMRIDGAWWATATIRIVVAAQDLPFDPDPTNGATPDVVLTDTVNWAGRVYRVTGHYAWSAPGPQGPKPAAYFVGLAS